MQGGNNGRKNYDYLHGQSLLTSINPPINEGYQVDIQSKTRIEILELLERQQKLVSNQSFLQNLPDGGEKIRRKVDQLQTRLRELDEQDFITRHKQKEILNTTSESKMVDEQTDGINAEDETNLEAVKETKLDDLKIVERGFNNLSIHEGPFYEVVKNASKQKKKSKFILNRQSAKESPPKPKPPTKPISSSSGTADSNIDTMATPMTSQNEPGKLAKLISVDECRQLHAHQQAVIKVQQAALTAERLLARYGGTNVGTAQSDLHTHPEGQFEHEESSDVDEGDVHMEEALTDLNEVD